MGLQVALNDICLWWKYICKMKVGHRSRKSPKGRGLPCTTEVHYRGPHMLYLAASSLHSTSLPLFLLSRSLFIHPRVNTSVRPSVHLSIRSYIHPSICFYIHTYNHAFIDPYILSFIQIFIQPFHPTSILII
jgi:hypothetical protein